MKRSLTTKSNSKSNVVARLTVIRQNGRRVIVEVHRDATFHQFYRFYVQEGKRWSTKRQVRTASRNESLPVINTHLHKPGLDVIEIRLKSFQKTSNPVMSSKLQIFRKRLYKKLCNAQSAELGMTNLITMDLQTQRRPILVSLPSFRLVEKVNHKKLHAGAVR
ncbi:MAG: hypothetical protein L0287_10045 [Anaerolineae bacterium]|nr:hypothetical protein [Anaerolineae bacterium]